GTVWPLLKPICRLKKMTGISRSVVLLVPSGAPPEALDWLATEIDTAAAAIVAGAPAPELQSLRAAAASPAESNAASRAERARAAARTTVDRS
ncbi:MAG: hypothetical protein ABMA64_36265, partial [Myxococcota bacterium]